MKIKSRFVNLIQSVSPDLMELMLYYYYRCKSPKKVAEKLYIQNFGRAIDWANPKELNEKIRWMQFYSDTSLWPILADKYLVRDFVKEKGMGHILVPLYGVWENVNEINFHDLPNSFVMKTNHGCGDVYIVKDKNEYDLDKMKKGLRKSLSKVYGWKAAEIHYYKIPSRIIAEKLLSNDCAQSSSIVDYKFYCFYGKPFCCGVFYDRGASHNASFYDMNWQRHDDWRSEKLSGMQVKQFEKPITFDKMKEACMTLGSELPFVRLDFYESEGNLYFGEFTLTPSQLDGGSLNHTLLKKMGEMLVLPAKIK